MNKKTFLSAVLLISLLISVLSGCGTKKEKYIDLHLHLDGALTVETAYKLGRINGFTLPEEEELKNMITVPADCADLNDFLKCFDYPLSLMQTPDALSNAVYYVCEDIKENGVIYAEIRFAPQFHTDKGMTQEDAILAALDGLKKTDLKANLILCCMRGEGNEEANDETVELAKKYLVKDGGVVAIDIAGAEAIFPTENYKDLFAKARDYGIPFTIHAGEADGADSVRLAIEYGAKRIGHGVRSYEDPDVVNMLKEKGVFLEMCPTSNRQTHAVEDMSKYPFMDYLNDGVLVTLNTDDPGIEGTTIGDEYRYMESEFGLTKAQEKTLLSNSVDAAFTTDEVKQELKKELGID